MTTKRNSSLILEGNEIKFFLEAERVESKTAVHVDWVSFTALLRRSPYMPSILEDKNGNIWDSNYRQAELNRILKETPDPDFSASSQSLQLAEEVCMALGDGFKVSSERKKGLNFYRFRWSIERNGFECGWVGFLASGDSPRQASQSETIHCNLSGTACTFAAAGWRDRLAAVIEESHGKLTRVDLALDFFDGFPGGIQAVKTDYESGLCDVGGRRLKCNMVGDWSDSSKGARSFYFGSKEAGKETNAYEKGDQLFGVESGSKWLRVELRNGNKLRVLPLDMLRRPADFFAGASDWHASVLRLANETASPEKIRTTGRLPLETVQAETSRNLRWIFQTAAASIGTAFKYLANEDFIAFVEHQKLPGRLQKFTHAELSKSFSAAFGGFSRPESSPAFVMA